MPDRPDAQVYCAVPTPFDAGGHLDRRSFRDLLERLEPHVDGSFTAGTTGEFPALDDLEREALFAASVDVLGADRVIAHVGSASLRQTLRLSEIASGLGIRRLAAITPYYLPADFGQVHALYAAIAERYPDREVYAYVFPERTGVDVSPAELGELAAIDGVAGAKLSGRPNERFAEYVAAAPGMVLYSGDATRYDQVVAAGGRGTVAALAAAYPEPFAAATAALRSGGDASGPMAEVHRVAAETGGSIRALKAVVAERFGGDWGVRMSMT